jgi:hypothetical protein
MKRVCCLLIPVLLAGCTFTAKPTTDEARAACEAFQGAEIPDEVWAQMLIMYSQISQQYASEQDAIDALVPMCGMAFALGEEAAPAEYSQEACEDCLTKLIRSTWP